MVIAFSTTMLSFHPQDFLDVFILFSVDFIQHIQLFIV